MTRKQPANKQPATRAGGSWWSRVSPRLITALVLTAFALTFIIQNNQLTEIRVIVPVVTMPLWAALAAMLIVGAAIGYATTRRQR